LLFTSIALGIFFKLPLIVELKIYAVTLVSNNGVVSRKLQPSIFTVSPFIILLAVLFEKLQEYNPIEGVSSLMRIPVLFSRCVAFSSGTFTDQEIIAMPDDNYKMYFGEIFGKYLVGEKRISDN